MEHKYRKTVITTLVLSGLYGNSSAEVIMDGSAGTAGEIKATTPDNVYEIDSTQGTVSGHNLFHSFSQFNVEQNHTADFTDSTYASISNIIARVTGPDASHIDGTIQSSIPNADFYLLNPNGIMFGKGASIDINGSFYASTANYLKFDDGYKLDQIVTSNMTFTSASPSAFGFTTDTPGNIGVNGSNLLVDSGKTLSLIGGDISLDSATLSASDGVVNIASRASQGEVVPSSDDLQMNGFTGLGNIDLANGSKVDVSGDKGGRIIIRGGSLTLDQSNIQSVTAGNGIEDQQKTIDVVTSTNVALNNQSNITSTVSSTGNSNGATIKIDTDHLNLSDYSSISTSTTGTGNGSDVTINARELKINNGARITTSSQTNADTGNITIHSEDVSIVGPEFSWDPFGDDFTGISSHKSYVSSGQGGNINIDNTNDFTLDLLSRIETVNEDAADGGNISINSGSLNILRGAEIVSDASDAQVGSGGNIYVSTENLDIVGGYNTLWDETIHSALAIYGPNSRQPRATGNTGNLNINTNNFDLIDGGTIFSLSRDSTGNMGNIDIQAKNMLISGFNTEERDTYLDFGLPAYDATQLASSQILAESRFKSTGSVDAKPVQGTVSITSDRLSMEEGAFITTSTVGDSNSNNIEINTNILNLKSGSYITSSSVGSGKGNAGDININANKIVLDGKDSQFVRSGLYSNADSFGEGTGGKININAKGMSLTNDALITTETSGNGGGGNIEINSTDYLVIENNSSITTKASETSNGNAGNITAITSLFVLDSSEITTTAISGRGGDITINAENLIITPDSIIDASSQQSVSGVIDITANSNLSSSLVPLAEEPIDTSPLKNECAQIRANDSSFLVRNDVTYNSMDNLIPSYYSYAQNSRNNIENSEATATIKNPADNIYEVQDFQATWNIACR